MAGIAPSTLAARRRDRRTVVLLGPQHGAPRVAPMLAELGITGKVALVNAGYQENERDDAALIALLGVPAVNLGLHRRAADVFAADTELTAGYRARQLRLRDIQAFYRVRLEKTEEAAKMIAVRYVDAELLAQEDKVSLEQFRQLDASHVERCLHVRAAFDATWQLGERPSVAAQRAELREILDGCDALVIAGGHVASLYNRLALFDVVALASPKPVIAWSAGAMILTDRIVLFHDYPPYGSDVAQLLDAGLGLAPGIVVLPDPKRRVRMDDADGISRFARRMSPATCVVMDHGDYVIFEGGALVRASAARLMASGGVDGEWRGGTP